MFNKLLIAAGTLVLIVSMLLALALYNLGAVANSNKEYFIARAEAEIGRNISVGSLGVGVVGGISLRAKDLTLEDDPAFSSEPFARIGELRMTVRFWPLLWKQVEIKRILVTAPSITLIRDTMGHFNFDSLEPRSAKRAANSAEKTQDEDTSPGKRAKPRRRILPPLLAVGKIVDGAVRYIDRKRALDLAIRSLDLTVKPADAQGQFAVAINAAVLSDNQNLKIAGKVGPIVAGAPLAELPIDVRLALAPVDVAALSQKFPALLTALPKDLQVRGALQLKEAAVDGTPKTFRAKVDLNADQTEIQWRKEFFKPAAVPLQLKFEGQISEDSIDLRKTEIRLRDLNIAVNGMSPLRRVGDVDMAFKSNQFDAGGWEKLFPALEPYRLSGQAVIGGKVQVARKDGALRAIDVSLDFPVFAAAAAHWPRTISLTKATLRVSAVRDERSPKVGNVAPLPVWLPAAPTYNFAAAEIVVSPVKSDAPAGARAERLVGLKSEGEVAVTDGNIGYRGQVSASAGTFFKIDFRDLSTRLTLAEQTLQLSSLKLEALQGALKADGQYRFGGDTPLFSLTSHIDGLDIPQFARTVLGAEPKRLRGRLKMDMTLSGEGRRWQEIQPTLRGQGSASVSRGALLNFNLAQQVLRKVTGVAGLRSLVPRSVRDRYPSIFNAADTEFDELKGDFMLANGLAQLQDVVLSAPDFGATGEGQIDFTGRLDFHGALLLSQKMTRDMTRAVSEVQSITGKDGRLALPFTAAGVLPHVKARPVLADIGKKLGGEILQKGLDRLRKYLPLPNQELSDQPNGNNEKKEPPATEKLIRKGLEWLLSR